MNSIKTEGVIIQDFQIDYVSLKLMLMYGEVHQHLSESIIHFYDHVKVSEIIIAKLHHSHDQSSADLYLLSVTQNATLVNGITKISDRNRCKHVHTFSNGNLSS